MERLITIGSATRDIFLVPGEMEVIAGTKITQQKLMAFEYGAKIDVKDLEIVPGGTAINVAVGLSRQGIEVAACCAVGKDDAGRSILEVLVEEGVDTALVQEDEGVATDRSLIIIDKKTGERTIFTSKGAEEALKLDCSFLGRADLYVSSLKYDWEQKLKTIQECIVEHKGRLFFTPGRYQVQAGVERLREFLNETEIVFMNLDEALEITHLETEDPGAAAKRVLQYGPRMVVITAGERGVYVQTETGELQHFPSKKMRVKDITGAGDAFVSGFLGAYLQGSSIEAAAKNGIDNSCSVIEEIGAIKGLQRK